MGRRDLGDAADEGIGVLRLRIPCAFRRERSAQNDKGLDAAVRMTEREVAGFIWWFCYLLSSFFIQGYQSLLRSSQCGLVVLMSAIFFFRSQPLSWVSRAMAL